MAFEISKLTRLYLGYVGENESRIIDIDVSDWLEQWPDAIIAMTVQRPKENNTYIPVTEVNGGVLSWTVRREDVAIAGNGMAQIRAIQPSTGRVYMSRVVPTVIAASMTGEIDDGAVPPESGWVNTVLMAAADAQQSEDDAKGHADRAEAAVADLEQTRADAIADVLQTAETETSKATAAIAQKGADTLASIPEDYTSLAADVSQLSEEMSDFQEQIADKTEEPVTMEGVTHYDYLLVNGSLYPYDTPDASNVNEYDVTGLDNETVFVTCSTNYGNYFYSVLDADGNVLLKSEPHAGGGGTTYLTDVEVKIPSGASKLLVAWVNWRSCKAFYMREMYTPKGAKEWLGKKWTCVGDSLTEVNSRTTLHYHDYVAAQTGITVVNMGVSGTGYGKKDEENLAFYQRIANVPTDSDVVTIFGSFNDMSGGKELGTITDTGTETLCGCINTTIDTLISIMPAVQLGIVTPTPWIDQNPSDEWQGGDKYVQAIIDICKRRSIPCLDLYHCSNLRPWTEEGRAACYTKDDGNGVHPDETGHKLIAARFKAFLETLIM